MEFVVYGWEFFDVSVVAAGGGVVHFGSLSLVDGAAPWGYGLWCVNRHCRVSSAEKRFMC